MYNFSKSLLQQNLGAQSNVYLPIPLRYFDTFDALLANKHIILDQY